LWRRSSCPDLGAIGVTGLIWLGVFWRQFSIHEYWAFYLGPWVAASIAFFLVQTSRLLRPRLGQFAFAPVAGVVIVLGVYCFRGTQQYFDRSMVPLGDVQGWKAVNQLTTAQERIVIAANPVLLDDYDRRTKPFRNIFPAFAYYCDRAFTATEALDRYERSPEGHSLLLIRQRDVPLGGSPIQSLLARYQTTYVGTYLIVDFRKPRSA